MSALRGAARRRARAAARRGPGGSSRSTSSTRSTRRAGTYDGDVAGFIGRALPIVTEIVPLPASAGALRRARLHALAGGGEVTDGRAVLRVAG